MISDYKAGVRVWEEVIEIPTYGIGEPDKNPMFLEKRVYQGSSGKVYPWPVIDKIYDEKESKSYRVVFLENEYLLVMIMPELGGRIQRAFDKTNQYDFVYYNQVIKPALVGLIGPWISGGIEFNWPQHHRPNTFGHVDYCLDENVDGSKTVWVSEVDRMHGTKGMAGFTLYPEKAYIEIKGQLFNGTELPQTFLWWANPAVAVNQNTQSIFPPDVNAVMDHGKRDVSKFPMSTSTYYKMDYSAGVDISRYKNLPVPTSYMAYESDFDFIGGYDYGVDAGILHVANHHISPGKKQWTWGNGDFGQAWDRNLTDEDGPYIELMTGVYTDNQPDFTWLKPYEEKTFYQYFMPYKDIGVVKNANIDIAISLEVLKGEARVGVYVTSLHKGLIIILRGNCDRYYIDDEIDLDPTMSYKNSVKIDSSESTENMCLIVYDAKKNILIKYSPTKRELKKMPEPAMALKNPEEILTNEELYFAGTHIEQYRHATYESEDYYMEGLKRDKNDVRINNAYGLLMFRRGKFSEAQQYFEIAIDRITRFNANPYDSESFYNLGLSLIYQGNLDDAYKYFYKSTWSDEFQSRGNYQIAQIDCIKGEYLRALEHIEKSLVNNTHNCRARDLKVSILRKIGWKDKAMLFARDTIEIDRLDFGAMNELVLINNGEGIENLIKCMRNDVYSYINLARNYGKSGFYNEAINILLLFIKEFENETDLNPMLYYYIAYYYMASTMVEKAAVFYDLASKANPIYCFPNDIYDIQVLESAIRINSSDSKAYYYLGNLLYDKKQYVKAIECWEKSEMLDDSYPTASRNLALAYYNKIGDKSKARLAMEKAFECDNTDARVLLELDQLYKKIGIPIKTRLNFLENHIEVVKIRDDLYIEYITLLNSSGQHKKALLLIKSRQFHPWEGGEGKVTKQYVYSNIELAKDCIKISDYKKAINYLNRAKIYPRNLGEGKLKGAQENNINYYLGISYDALGDTIKAREYYLMASKGLDTPVSAMFYNDQPPEMIFYQGLALLKIDDRAGAFSRFNKLISYGEQHMIDDVKIDYFAVSLPDFLIFDEDLNRRNVIHCHYLIGLGYLGLGKITKSEYHLIKALNLDIDNQGVINHLNYTHL